MGRAFFYIVRHPICVWVKLPGSERFLGSRCAISSSCTSAPKMAALDYRMRIVRKATPPRLRFGFSRSQPPNMSERFPAW